MVVGRFTPATLNLCTSVPRLTWQIDLLKRVTTVSVETVRITKQLAELSNIDPNQNSN